MEPRAPRLYNMHHRDAPDDAVYIGRGTPWGNPFVLGVHGNRDMVCALFENMAEADPLFKKQVKLYLKGKDLVCWCHPLRCHGDYLLRVANGA